MVLFRARKNYIINLGIILRVEPQMRFIMKYQMIQDGTDPHGIK